MGAAMTRKPWQVWLVFCVCLAIVTAVMMWLSVRVVRLESLREVDRNETEVARREAVLQERVSAALYRMDLLLIPLVSEESARPHQHYQSVFYPAIANEVDDMGPENNYSFTDLFDSTASNGQVSPLYEHPPEMVKLHFEVLPDGQFVCPQVPDVWRSEIFKIVQPELAAKLPQSEVVQQRKQSLATMQATLSFESLRGVCGRTETNAVNLEVLENGFAYQSNGYQVPAIDRAVERFNAIPRARGDVLDPEKAVKGNKLEVQQAQNDERLMNDLSNRLNLNLDIAQRQQAFAYGNSQGGSSLAPKANQAIEVLYGVMQPVWIDGNLLLVRPLQELGQTRYQCCWLDWPRIQQALRKEVGDLLPMDEINFESIELDDQFRVGMALTTLPVQLSMDRAKLRMSFSLASDPALAGSLNAGTILSLAWSGFLLSAVVAGFLLQQVVSLSERRASFVSAVTHELRTPLTTFRMYSEMLSSDMVPPDKRKQYVGTLRKQANRLSHLVENVLQFARLESNPSQGSEQEAQVGGMLERFVERLETRTNEEGLELLVQMSESVNQSVIRTQPAMVEQVLFNLVDNACKYGKPSTTGKIELRVTQGNGQLRLEVSDGGPGVDAGERRRMFHPFHKSDLEAANSEPGVGLGLALCKRMALSLGGKLSYRENESGGATFELSLPS